MVVLISEGRLATPLLSSSECVGSLDVVVVVDRFIANSLHPKNRVSQTFLLL